MLRCNLVASGLSCRAGRRLSRPFSGAKRTRPPLSVAAAFDPSRHFDLIFCCGAQICAHRARYPVSTDRKMAGKRLRRQIFAHPNAISKNAHSVAVARLRVLTRPRPEAGNQSPPGACRVRAVTAIGDQPASSDTRQLSPTSARSPRLGHCWR